MPLYQHTRRQKIVIPPNQVPSNWTQLNGSLANAALTQDPTGYMVVNTYAAGSNPNTDAFWTYNLFSSTAAKTFVFKIYLGTPLTGLSVMFFGFRNSANNRAVTYGLRRYVTGANDMQSENWTITNGSLSSAGSNGVNGTSWSANTFYWVKGVDDGTNHSFYLSTDGVNFGSPYFTLSKSSWTGSHDQIMFGVAPASTNVNDFRIYSLTIT